MKKLLFSAILSLYSIMLAAQDNSGYSILEVEHHFNNITKALQAQPNNVNLLLERLFLVRHNAFLFDNASDTVFNFLQYKTEDIIKDADYLINNVNSINTDSADYTTFDFLLLKARCIPYTDTINLYKAHNDIIAYIKKNQQFYSIQFIYETLNTFVSKYIHQPDFDDTTINTFFTASRLNAYASLFNSFYPIETAQHFDKNNIFMIYELLYHKTPLNKYNLFEDNIDLNNRRINYYKKLIHYTNELFQDKAMVKKYNLTPNLVHALIYNQAIRIAKLYYANKDYKNAKLWMEILNHDIDNNLANKNIFNAHHIGNNYFYKELLNITLEDKNANLNTQFAYILSLLDKEYYESLDTAKNNYILQVINTLEPKATKNPTFFYLKAYALFSNRYYHIQDYKNYTDNIFALLDKANALGLNNASMDFIRGAIYQELGDNTLANQYFDKAIKANPDKYTLPAKFYGDPDISYLIDNALGIKPLHSNIQDHDYTIPKKIINLAKIK